MKKLFLALLFALAICTQTITAQTVATKIVVVNGGRYEFTPPFQDYVTVGVFDRNTRQYTLIDTIQDQSVLDVITFGKGGIFRAYVVTQSTVTAYDLNTNTRIAQRTGLDGANKLAFQDPENFTNLVLTRGYGTPSGAPYVLFLDKDNLSTVGTITGISDECSSLLTYGGKAYVAVPGNFMGRTGNLAIINLQTASLERELQLDTNGKGIESLYRRNNNLIALCSGPYGSNQGKIATVNLSNQNFQFTTLNHPIGDGSGQFGNTIYADLVRSTGLGKLDASTFQIQDSLSIKWSFAGAAIDTINQQIVLTEADYVNNAITRIYDFNGIKLDSFNVGISPEAVAIAYNNPTATGLNAFSETQPDQFVLYPNPSTGIFYVKLSQPLTGVVRVFNHTGQEVLNSQLNQADNQINLTGLPKGIYQVRIGGLAKSILLR